MEETLFSNRVKRPLADRLRPQRLQDVVGQEQVLVKILVGQNARNGEGFFFYPLGPPGVAKQRLRD